MLGGIACAIRGVIPPWVGVWSADIVLAAVGIALFLRISGK